MVNFLVMFSCGGGGGEKWGDGGRDGEEREMEGERDRNREGVRDMKQGKEGGRGREIALFLLL